MHYKMEGGAFEGSPFELISMRRLTGGPIVKKGLYGVGRVWLGRNLKGVAGLNARRDEWLLWS